MTRLRRGRTRAGGPAIRHAVGRALGAVLGLALWLAAAAGFVPALAPGPATAATPSLTITSDATYEALPDQGRVAVTARLTVTNHLKNTITHKLSYRIAYLAVQPGTSGFRLAGGSGSPRVSVQQSTDAYTTLKLDFGTNLAAGKSMTLSLAFDIRDTGGDPGRAVRVSPSLITFEAWAFATPSTPGSTVLVQLPAAYLVTVGRGPLQGPTTAPSGEQQWSSGPLAKPLDFVADVVAGGPVEYAETPLAVALPSGMAAIDLRAWPDDPAWRDRVTNLVTKALPILQREIGLAWPVDGQLQVNEVLVRGSAGYAGVFDPAERRVDISYSASDEVVIHELAHAWFNGRLVADRWAAEAFASYYGELVTRALGLEIRPPDAVKPGPAAIPLNAWSADGGAGATSASDTYAYAASFELAREIAARAGAEQLRAVWDLASRGVGAYRPEPGTEEPVAGAPDWRGLLDLLEEQTGKDFGDLWRKWVARPEDLAALDSRASARVAYAETVEAAGAWHLPITIRDAMRSWNFDAAIERMATARAILGQRGTLAAAAASVGLQPPDSLRTAFEGPDGMTAATAEAASEQSTLEMMAAAESARPGSGMPGGLVDGIGLLFQDPADDLGAARLEFQSGNVHAAYDAALSARDAWRYAASAGWWRIVSIVLLAISLSMFFSIARRARRRAVQPA